MPTENKKLQAFLGYLPAIVTAAVAIVTFALYAAVIPEHKTSAYLAVCFIFALIFANRRWRLGLPGYLIVLICLHFVLAVDLGTALGMYKRFWWWDLFVHGYFGFTGCGILYYLFVRFAQREPNALHLIAFVLVTLSFAAIWEIYEFVADLFLHSDMQGVESAIAQGISPLTDTVTDMTIAIPGALIFYAVVFCIRAYRRKKQ